MNERPVMVAIVDDEESIRRALLRLFTLAHYHAEAFGSAGELLASLPLRTPGCVVLDLHLPGISGIELLQRFAALDNPPPVVVVTAHYEQHVREVCESLGIRGFLRKPLDCEALLDAVSRIVSPTP